MNVFKRMSTVATGALFVLAVGTASNASAAPVFTIDPTAYGGTGQFDADFVLGGSSTLVSQIGATTNYTSEGWIQFTGFQLGGSTVNANTTGLNSDYGLYATFNQTFACGSLLSAGVTCGVTGITLSLYADPGFVNTFTQASLGAAPTVTDVGSNDVLLATANLVLSGTAGINSLGGAFENVNTNFLLTLAGSGYFISPVPFYNLAFSEFNNTSLGIVCDPSNCVNATQVAITGESGGTQFLAVPEPGSLALMALGVLGMGMVRRRMKA